MSTERIDAISKRLLSFRYRFTKEVDLHQRIEEVLKRMPAEFEREVRLGPLDRVDFLIENSIVLEVKIDGSFPEALRQVDRYCKHEIVTGVIIASSTRWGQTVHERSSLHEKPVSVIHIQRVVF